MSRTLDILALEPFFGGVRRAMLEAIVAYSRHRWTVLKLPPRRLERRLTTAANWFTEQLSRHWVGHMDLLFTSEAMNLASLHRLMPYLAGFPSIVYFHDNQLPDLSSRYDAGSSELDLVNFNTAQTATEVWFNSQYHKQTFFILARAIVDRNQELALRDPLPAIGRKVQLVPPPVDLSLVRTFQEHEDLPERQQRTIFVETRDANMDLLNGTLRRLRELGVPFRLMTVGPVDKLDPTVERTTVGEQDTLGQVRAMFESNVFFSAKPGAASDYQALRALACGCRPVFPDAGVYAELLPPALQRTYLHAVDPNVLAHELATAIGANAPQWDPETVIHTVNLYDANTICRYIDDRIEQIAAAHPHPQLAAKR